MREVVKGVWHWEAPHPDWTGPENEALHQRLTAMPATPNEAVRGVVSSYAVDDDERLLLFDPLTVPREIEELAAAREPVVVLTCPWHERDTQSLAGRLGAPVFTPTPDEGTPDVAWLLGADRSDAHLYSAGDRLPVGVEALPGRLPNDLVLWIESRRAVIAGDTLVDFGQGLEIPVEWLPEDVTREQVAEGYAPCSSCRSTSYSQHTAGPQIRPPSSARSPDNRASRPVHRRASRRLRSAGRGGTRGRRRATRGPLSRRLVSS